jgi:muramoyltetrapeptide carboxypeptidase
MAEISQPERVRPAALLPGDTVGIVAPSSGFRRDELEAGCAHLLRLGYKPFYLPSIFDRDLYFGGPIRRRVEELHEMFRRPEVKAILCARGGYGCNYLLPHLDLELIRANPKIIAGCSDVTTLLTWLGDATGLVTFHGPMVAGDFARPDGIEESSWKAAVACDTPYRREFVAADGIQVLKQGTAEGVLYGGCLSLLVASLGTPYEIRTDGTILFIEDRAERPYRIDRMLMQLKLAGKFDGVRGIVFGEMIDCNEAGALDYTLTQVIMRIIRYLDVPIVFGLKSGHVSSGALTLPLGVKANVVARETAMVLGYEAAVQKSPAAVRS